MTVRTVHLGAAALTGLLCLAAAPAFGLDSIGEDFGNTPIRARAGFSPGVLSILDDPHRVYLYFVASDGYKSFTTGYFQGDTAAAHAALRQFSALEKGLDVVLLPGPREVTSLDGKRKVRADWELYVPTPGERGGGRQRFDMRPILFLFVRGRIPVRPAVPATAAQVEQWLKELDARAFQERERASGQLETQGAAVRDALHKALEGNPPPEARRRIGLLLTKLEGLPGVNLGELAVPAGVRVLGPDDLLARHREALKSEYVRVGPDAAERAAEEKVVRHEIGRFLKARAGKARG